MGSLIESIETFLSVIFPGSCLACGCELMISPPNQYPVCADCISHLVPVRGLRCDVCSARLISERRICTRCRETRFSFDSSHSLFEYRGIIKELIYQYKFEGRTSISNLFSRLLGDALYTMHPGIQIVPVPSAKKSRQKRGFDHMRVITDKIRKAYGIASLIVLSRKTDVPQKELAYAERLSNLRGKIGFESKQTSFPFEAVIIDDVFTTGATCEECARVLKENGARRVHVLTLAID